MWVTLLPVGMGSKWHAGSGSLCPRSCRVWGQSWNSNSFIKCSDKIVVASISKFTSNMMRATSVKQNRCGVKLLSRSPHLFRGKERLYEKGMSLSINRWLSAINFGFTTVITWQLLTITNYTSLICWLYIRNLVLISRHFIGASVWERKSSEMMLRISLALLASLALATCSDQVEFPVVDSGIENYPQKATVFGVPLLATPSWTQAEINHVASILAKYIDNDEDGCPGSRKLSKFRVLDG